MSDTDSQALQGPPKTLTELSRANRGWSPKGARWFVGFLVFFYSMLLITFTLDVLGRVPQSSLSSNFLMLVIVPVSLVRFWRDKKYPLSEAVKRGYSNPDYPPEEAAFVHRLFKLYLFATLAYIAGAVPILIGGIGYAVSARTQDDAMAAVYCISGGLAVCPMIFVKVRRVYRRIDAEWGSYVAQRDGFSEKESA